MTKRDYLKHLVAGKKQAFRPLTAEEKALGFLGWHERGYLPHCDFPDLVQFVTFRLEDSMPVSRSGEWKHLLAIEDVREKRIRLEEYLDRGIGKCQLRDSHIAALVEQAILHRHGEQYEMLAWVVMPNHFHVLVHVWRTPLWKMVQRWKTWVATHAERRAPARRESKYQQRAEQELGAPAGFWQREYWDTYMRDAEQERKSIRYIEGNPARAKLVLDPAAWPFGSARFRDAKTWELQLPPAGTPSSGSAR
ncbi:MAG TPA: transposase [Verrucomicrobiae bacterium]|nr:transposase [Verrucomicrobiae bacterium]